MSNVVKETQCTRCDHLAVCSLNKQFVAAQKAVDDVNVPLGGNSIKGLRYFDWIRPVELECIHFTDKKPKPREIQSSFGMHFMEDSD